MGWVMIDILILTVKQKKFKVSLVDYNIVNESDIASLLNKTATDVWRWARFNRAKVKFADEN